MVKNIMANHFNLSKQEFLNNDFTFSTLEITSKEAVDKNYQDLRGLLKKQFNRLILVNHPDKGGDKNRFHQINEAYQELKEYIKPLESGNPCVKVNIHTESDGHLTAREFNYRKKLFAELNITSGEVVKKTLEEIISILESKDNRFKTTRKNLDELKMKIQKVSQNPILSDFEKIMNIAKLQLELNEYLAKPSMQLLAYIIHLEDKQNLIVEDKKALALKFIERKNVFLLMESSSMLPLTPLITITIVCYFSWWILAFNLIFNIAYYSLIKNYTEKYKNSEISTDEFMNKINYIQLGSKLLIFYPLGAFSVYLLATNFVSNGLTIGGVILGPLLALAILIAVLAPIFSKGCEIYTEKHTKDLLEENPRDRVQKATDLLKWYDLRRLLMPIIMPLVEKYFVELTNELAERNLNEVNTNMSDVSQPIEAIEFTQQVPV